MATFTCTHSYSVSHVRLFCDPIGCSLPSPSVHGIFQARILEWVAIPFSRGLPNQRTEPMSPALTGAFFPTEIPGSPPPHLTHAQCAFISGNQSGISVRLPLKEHTWTVPINTYQSLTRAKVDLDFFLCYIS